MTKIYNKSGIKKFRKNLRENMTEPEIILWSKIKNKQILDCKFRRQYSIGNFVVDFYSTEIKLAIEIDGDSHYLSKEKLDYDENRTKYLEQFGIIMIRFTNIEIRKQLEDVLDYLFKTINDLRKKQSKDLKPHRPIGHFPL